MSGVPKGAGSVLVIDDDVHFRSTVVELLREEGYEVAQASNGYTGLRLAAEQTPHVVLLDLALPEVSGLDVLAELRKHPVTRDLPVIILTAKAVAEVPTNLGVQAVLQKPVGVGELVENVHRAVVAAEHRREEVPPALIPAPGLAPHDRLVPPHRATRSRSSRLHRR